MASMTARKSNVERFPAIGRHLIDDATPAYAPTQPPEAAHAATDIGADQVVRYSRWSPAANVLLIIVAFLWSGIRRD